MATPSLAESAGTGIGTLANPAQYWEQMFDIWLIIAVGIYVVVAVPLVYFLIRYRYREGINEKGAKEDSSAGIEVLWSVIPLMIVIYLAFQSAAFYERQRTAPADAIEVKVEGMMWAWLFEYENGKQTANMLTVPVGKPVKLLLTSRDVVHSFSIPDAKVMEDAVPGRVTHMWFQFNETGEYRSFCREYCGTAHAFMLATIKVVSPEEYERWLTGA